MRGRTVHVVDDDDAMRESLVALLEDAGYDARAYASAEQLLAGTPVGPGCIVSDIRLPGMDGLTLLRTLRAQGTEMPLILITGHADVQLAVAAMKAGAVDFLEKPFIAEALHGALDAGFRRQTRLALEGEDREPARGLLALLTAREREVFERLVLGETNKEAARSLGVSHRTVEFHRAHIMQKTGARGLPDLVRLWIAAHGRPEPATGREHG